MKNRQINEKIELNRYEDNLFSFLSSVFLTLKGTSSSNRHSIYVFGGWVRDKLLSRLSADFDVCIPKTVIKPFIDALQEADPSVKVNPIKLDEFPKIGHTLYNIKIKRLNAKLGITALEIDLERELLSKDFTVNSLCYDLVKRQLIKNKATEKGMEDLKRRILDVNSKCDTTLASAPSRIIRMIRLSLSHDLDISDRILRYFKELSQRKRQLVLNNSLINQFQKLVKFVNNEKKHLYRFMELIKVFRIDRLVTIWFNYRNRSIVLFLVKDDLNKLKQLYLDEMIDKGQHYVIIKSDLKSICFYHQKYPQ